MAPLVLYYCAPSAACRGALLTIRNLNLDVTIKEVNLFEKEQLKPEFVKMNPQHVVPTLDDDGFILWESRAISEYIVESKSPNSTLIPKNIKERAIMNRLLYFDMGVLWVRARNIFFPAIFLGETKITDDKRKQLYEAIGWLDGFLEGRKWLVNDNVTIADLSILASMASIIHAGANISNYKNLSAWYERCKSLPGFKENDEGGKIFGDKVKSKLEDKL